MKTLGKKELKACNFTWNEIEMERLGKNEPCLILMNHSCFMDLEIAETIMYPRHMYIICTSDDFVGKEWLMRHVGCIPTNKFVADFVMVKTYGAFAHDPLYNNLQKRNVKVSADVKYLLSPEDIQNKSTDELNKILKQEFTFDNWKYQQENKIKIAEPFRADCLNRVLYKCTCCKTEGKMTGKGTELFCNACAKNGRYDLYWRYENSLLLFP